MNVANSSKLYAGKLFPMHLTAGLTRNVIATAHSNSITASVIAVTGTDKGLSIQAAPLSARP